MPDIADLLIGLVEKEHRMLSNRPDLHRKGNGYAKLWVETIKLILREHTPVEEQWIEQRMKEYAVKRSDCYSKLTDKARKREPHVIVDGPDMIYFICQDPDAIQANAYFVMKHIRNDPYDDANRHMRDNQESR
jgi:hypothetical protein